MCFDDPYMVDRVQSMTATLERLAAGDLRASDMVELAEGELANWRAGSTDDERD